MEMTIAYRLVSKGWSDNQITRIADECFPHHMEWVADHPNDPNHYIDTTLASARQRLFKRRGLVSSPLGGNPRKAYPKKRPFTSREFGQIKVLARGRTKAELVQEAARELDRSRTTIYRRIAELEKTGALQLHQGRLFPKPSP
jgi:hypothetical protein